LPDSAKRLVKSSLRSLGYTLLDLQKNNDLRVFLAGHLKSVFATLQINCVIDVGANVGDYGRMLRQIGYAGRIVSIEPVSAAFARLQEAAAGDRDWVTHRFACGSSEEERSINLFSLDVLNSFLPPSEHFREIDPAGVKTTEIVTVRRLDSILDDALKSIERPRVFLKTDTQGFDLEVLKGAGRRIQDVAGLQSEVSLQPLYENAPDYLEFLSYCRELGFAPTGFFPIFHSPLTKQMVEMDAVLTRAPTDSGGNGNR
jgi:FkbM family methyltransferase